MPRRARAAYLARMRLPPALALLALVGACGAPESSAPPPQAPTPPAAVVEASPTGTAALRERSPAATCAAKGPLPDPSCTPGAVMAGVTQETICTTSTKARRKVAHADHVAAFTEYGYSYPQAPHTFEVDHLIPLELGGDNVIANLWAESASPAPGFHEKDKVENYLHKEVCAGWMPLAKAQHIIATNWIEVWNRISSDSAAVANDDDDGEAE
jgi:hypothetical protein